MSKEIHQTRILHGWTFDGKTWRYPDGTTEKEWRADGLPMPEEDGYADFVDAYEYYETMDARS